VVAEIGVRFICLVALGCLPFRFGTLSSETFPELFWAADRGGGRLSVACSDSSGDDLENFGGAGAFDLNLDHEGLFLNGDLVRVTFPLRSVTAFFELIDCWD
jgi:hypothetical protein